MGHSDTETSYPLNAGGRPIKGLKSKIIAIILTLLFSGLGHLYLGLWKRAAAFIIIEILTYIAFGLVISATDDFSLTLGAVYVIICIVYVLIWFYSMADAVKWTERNNSEYRRYNGIPEDSIPAWPERATSYGKDLTGKVRRNTMVSPQQMIENPRRAIVMMSLVVSTTFIVIKVNGFLDTMWASHISGEATAAISSVNPLFTVVSCMGVGIGTGACICISYALGKRDHPKTQELSEAAVFMALGASIPTMLFLLFALEPVVSVQTAEVAELARQYVIPLVIGGPFIIFSGVLTSMLKSEGAVGKMALCTLISVPVNAILTPLFINEFYMGVSGSSTATAVSMFVSAAVAFVMLRYGDFHFRIRLRVPTESSIKDIAVTGGPIAIDTLVFGLLMLAQTIVITIKTGSMTLSVIQMAFAFPYLMLIIPDSITSGSMPVCSALAGAHRIDEMKRSMRFSVRIAIILAILSSAALLLFAEPILSLFSSGKSFIITDELILCTRIYALSIPFFLIGRVFAGFLQTVRKAYISTPVNLMMISIGVVMIYILAANATEVVVIQLVMYVLTAAVMGAVLLWALRRYDPDAVDSMIDNNTPYLWSSKRRIRSSD